MSDNEPFDRYQFVISYELLSLLEWLINHKQDGLQKLIQHAVDSGFECHSDSITHDDPDELHHTIVEFFGLIDALLHDAMKNDAAKNDIKRALIPSINNLDTAMYDSAAVSSSIEKATAAAQNPRGRNPKEVLCKELLKRWKPNYSQCH